ncbi:MAG: hypothetical protein ACQEP1_04975 [Nanobdellota archaeon]
MKKAQVTNFLVMGAIIIIMVAVFLFLRHEVLKEVEPDDVVSGQYSDVEGYVEQCVKDTALEGVRMLGSQGGYIYIPDTIESNPFSYMKPLGGGMFKVPYWYYRGKNRIPRRYEMERDIQEYVKANVDSCLSEFRPLNKTYDVKAEEMNVKATIAEDNVIVDLFYPLHVERKDKQEAADMEDFRVKLDIPLKEIYDNARKILYEENEQVFLENNTIDLMAADPDIPITGMEISCQRNEWKLSEVRERINNILAYNYPDMKVENTDFEPFDEEETYQKNHFIFDAGLEETDMKVSFKYRPSWGLDLSAEPIQGNRLVSDKGKGLKDYISSFCLNVYHFTYDLTYPVMVTLKHDDYVFNFATPVIIKSNEASRQDFGETPYRAPPKGDDVCSQLTDEIYTIKAADKRTGFEIENANISFECINTECPLGETRFENSAYQLATKLPRHCTGGYVVADHGDYKETRKHISLDSANEDITLDMRQLKELEVDVARHTSSNPVLEKNLEEDQKVLISMENEDHNVFERYTSPDDNITLDVLNDDVTYDVEALLMEKDSLVGGFKYEWNVSYNELADADKLKLHVFEHTPKPTTLKEERDVMVNLNNGTEEEYLEPELVIE